MPGTAACNGHGARTVPSRTHSRTSRRNAMRMHRVTAAIVGVALALGIGIAQAHDEKGIPSKGEKPDAKLSLSGMSAAIGVGTTRGSGTLTYKRKAHPVRLRGLEVGGVGRARIEAHGEVYHLSNLADFDGTYVAIGAGAAAHRHPQLAPGAIDVVPHDSRGPVALVERHRGGRDPPQPASRRRTLERRRRGATGGD